MNHRDRIKNYISDYLENSLDPSTQKEFEDALENSPELRSMTKRILILSNRLSNLKYYHCSDEFTVKLRERIHSSPESFVSRQNFVRYSFAASFIIILIAAILTLTNLSSDSPGTIPDSQGEFQGPMNHSSPASNQLPAKEINTIIDNSEMDVGTKSNPNVVGDSLNIQKEKDKPPIKYVDQKE